MQGLINTVELARQRYGESARVFVDGFELDAIGQPITLPWPRRESSWLVNRIKLVEAKGTESWND